MMCIHDVTIAIIMADVYDGGDDVVFVYLGGEQEVPRNVRRVIIDRSVNIIPKKAFYQRKDLVSVEFHEGIEIDVGVQVFMGCRSIQKIKIPYARTIGFSVLSYCEQLTDAEFGSNLDTIGSNALYYCPSLRRITIPLKENLFPPHPVLHRCTQFDNCPNLVTVDLVGGIHKTISSLLLGSWRDAMNREVDRINQVLPNTPHLEKTDAIQQWIRSVLRKIEHYKAEHNKLLKEATTLLELAIWKAKLDGNREDDASILEMPAKKANLDIESIRNKRRITSGASIVIKNVLPFLKYDCN
eukprot:scaffold3797_cov91-Skeletonema_dohrnii-CCMP3373.AAC.6